jgi:hypothetical protein
MVDDQQRQLLRIRKRGFDMVPLRRQGESGTVGVTTLASFNDDLRISEDDGTSAFPHQLDHLVEW